MLAYIGYIEMKQKQKNVLTLSNVKALHTIQCLPFIYWKQANYGPIIEAEGT